MQMKSKDKIAASKIKISSCSVSVSDSYHNLHSTKDQLMMLFKERMLHQPHFTT